MYRITMAVREGVLKRGAFLFLLLCLTTLPACAAQKAEDAHLVDSSDLTIEEVVERILGLCKK